jgi:hypothetical protein
MSVRILSGSVQTDSVLTTDDYCWPISFSICKRLPDFLLFYIAPIWVAALTQLHGSACCAVLKRSITVANTERYGSTTSQYLKPTDYRPRHIQCMCGVFLWYNLGRRSPQWWPRCRIELVNVYFVRRQQTRGLCLWNWTCCTLLTFMLLVKYLQIAILVTLL